jgi:hypothetical protein
VQVLALYSISTLGLFVREHMPARAYRSCQSLDDVERRMIGAQASTTAAAIIAVTARLAGRASNRACDTKGHHHLHASAWCSSVGACDDWGLECSGLREAFVMLQCSLAATNGSEETPRSAPVEYLPRPVSPLLAWYLPARYISGTRQVRSLPRQALHDHVCTAVLTLSVNAA